MRIGVFQTRLGRIWLWGDAARLESDAPVVLAIAGLFARSDSLWFRLQAQLPEATVLAAQLPGHWCPELREVSVAAYAEAFGSVLQSHLGGRPVLVVGDSIGGVVALALPNPGVRRLALDPPLQTGGLWPLREMFRKFQMDEPHTRTFITNVFGFDGDDFANIDYRPIVRGPARVLMGEIPLDPPRPYDRLPSLLSEDDRRFLQQDPSIHTTVVMGIGHVIVWFEDLVVKMIREELQKAVRAWDAASPTWRDPPEKPAAKGG